LYALGQDGRVYRYTPPKSWADSENEPKYRPGFWARLEILPESSPPLPVANDSAVFEICGAFNDYYGIAPNSGIDPEYVREQLLSQGITTAEVAEGFLVHLYKDGNYEVRS